jgi:GT2 family glycosyltransferase
MKSIKSQTVLPDEVIIVDNNSDKDYISKLLDEEFPFDIRLIRMKYEGFDKRSKARNAGFSLCTEYVTFLDGDSFPENDMIEVLQSILKERPKSVICGYRNEIILDDITRKSIVFSGNISLYKKAKFTEMYSQCMTLDKTLITNLFDETFRGWGWEDTELCYRLEKQGFDLILSPKLIINHFFHEQQIKKNEEHEQFIKNSIYLIEKYNSEEINNAVLTFFRVNNMFSTMGDVQIYMKSNNFFDKVIDIDITRYCNLSCNKCNRLCNLLKTKKQMDIKILKNFIEQSIEKNHDWWIIRLAGGEPTTCENLNEYIEILKPYHLHNPKCEFVIMTNGIIPMINLPNWIGVINSLKSTDEVSHEFNYAFNHKLTREPSHDKITMNLQDYGVVPSDLRCNFTSYRGNEDLKGNICGITLTERGLFICPVANGIDKVFNLGLDGNYSLDYLDYEILKKKTEKACKLCAETFESKKFYEKEDIKEDISPTWVKALENYKK